MQDFVSTRWVRGAGLLASFSIAWIALVPYAFPWIGAAWVCVILAVVLLVHKRPVRSLRQLIDEGEADRAPVAVTARPVRRARRAVL